MTYIYIYMICIYIYIYIHVCIYGAREARAGIIHGGMDLLERNKNRESRAHVFRTWPSYGDVAIIVQKINLV